MIRETKYPYELATVIQADEERSVARTWDACLVCLFFIMLAGLAIYVMFHFPPAWDLSQ